MGGFFLLNSELCGLHLPNPLMLAAGILGISHSLFKRVAEAGAGAVVTKSIGLHPRQGYPNPTIVGVESGFINAMGLPNPGAKEFAKEINKSKDIKLPLIASIFGETPEEFSEVACIVEEAGAVAIELNVSCPHAEKVGAVIGQDPNLTSKVVKKVKSSVEIPIFVKLPPLVTDIREIAIISEKSGADALTVINTIRAMSIDIETGRPILSNKIGGLSGPAIKPIAVRCVFEVYEKVKIPVIGVGGITNWKDAIEFFMAGASAVQIGTAIAIKGLSVFQEIKEGLRSYLNKNDYKNYMELVGIAHRN